jgi:hypothetical protein
MDIPLLLRIMSRYVRFPGRLLSAVALLAALSARAEVRAVLHAPQDGEILRGGGQATVSWSAPQLPAFVEEWEAFLSVDGGKYYAYRITPHLDANRRQFTFEVPNVESEDARILIRAGDERGEIELRTPQTFVIRQDQARALAAAPVELIEARRGEPARPGDRGVIGWIDGNRDGSHLVSRSALAHESELARAPAVEVTSLCGEEESDSSIAAPPRAYSRLTLTAPRPLPRFPPRHRTGRDVLLTYRRLNI